MNGVEYAPGAEIQIEPYAPTAVDLMFPFPVDQASLEKWLPHSAAVTWLTAYVVRITIPTSVTAPAFKVPEVRSFDGTASVGLFVVGLAYPPSFVVSTYTPAEILAGAPTPRDRAPRVSAPRRAPAAFSPDAAKVLLYDAPGFQRTTGPRVVDVASGVAMMLGVPSVDDGPFIYAGWSQDRLVLVGRQLWVSDPRGSAMRLVADARNAAGDIAGSAAPSPRGTFVALAWSDRVTVVDDGDGSLREISRDISLCAGRGGPSLAWSLDERFLAWADCGATAGAARVRIAEVATARIVRTLAGGAYGIATLPTGDLIVGDASAENGEGARLSWTIYGLDGVAKAHYLGYRPTLSPDGRYLLDGTCCAGEGSTLTDLRTSGAQPKPFGGTASWLPDGRILVVNH